MSCTVYEKIEITLNFQCPEIDSVLIEYHLEIEMILVL